jgi:predicted ATPase
VIAIAHKHGLENNTLFWGKFGRGWAMTRLGNPEGGWPLMREAVVDAEAIHMNLAGPVFGYALASTLLQHGHPDSALAAIERYIPQAEDAGPREKLSEMYRLKGEALLRLGLETQGEEFLSLALETARQFRQKSNELRATMSLASLYRGCGETAQAGQMLSDVYSWFTEGFETPDLRQAKALLDDTLKGNGHVASI